MSDQFGFGSFITPDGAQGNVRKDAPPIELPAAGSFQPAGAPPVSPEALRQFIADAKGSSLPYSPQPLERADNSAAQSYGSNAPAPSDILIAIKSTKDENFVLIPLTTCDGTNYVVLGQEG